MACIALFYSSLGWLRNQQLNDRNKSVLGAMSRLFRIVICFFATLWSQSGFSEWFFGWKNYITCFWQGRTGQLQCCVYSIVLTYYVWYLIDTLSEICAQRSSYFGSPLPPCTLARIREIHRYTVVHPFIWVVLTPCEWAVEMRFDRCRISVGWYCDVSVVFVMCTINTNRQPLSPSRR